MDKATSKALGKTIGVMTALVTQLTERVNKLEARVAELEDARPSMGP